MVLDLLKRRYSCRNFSNRAVPEEVVQYMLECGRLSASGGNEQPWKFGVITDRALIQKLSEAASVNYSQKWIAKAPLIIALCTQIFENEGDFGMNRFPSIHDALQSLDPYMRACIDMEEHQTKIPGEHMVLAALEHGVYSTWISSVDCEKVGKLIGAEGYLVANLIAFGYPEEEREPTPKKALDSVVFTNHFNNAGFCVKKNPSA